MRVRRVIAAALGCALLAAGLAAAPPALADPSVPDAPAGVVALAGYGSADVTWDLPADNGSPLQQFVVTAHRGSIAGPTTDVAGGVESVVVHHLLAGSAYTFTVHAVNASGPGPESAESNPVTPQAGPPEPPADARAAAGDSAAVLTWTAPDDDGGTSVTGYTVTTVDVTASSSAGPFDVGEGLTATVTGLTNGHGYYFRVFAVNAAGPSATPTVTDDVVPAGLPGAPDTPQAFPGDRSATLLWNPPASDGGSPVTSYVVTPYLDGIVAQPATGVDGNTFSVSISGLAKGRTYTFTVTAVTAVGAGAPSAASTALSIPTSVPGAPGAVVAVPGDAVATVGWSAPGDDGGSPITSYTATAWPDGASCTTTGTSCAVRGLADGTAYGFTVVATNGIGDSDSSAPSAAVTPSGSAAVRWVTVPAGADYGSSITLSGRLLHGSSPIVGASVVLQVRPRGAAGFVTLPATARTDVAGLVTFRHVRITAQTEVRLAFAGTTGYGPSTSPVRTVAARRDLSIAAPKALPHSKKLRVAGVIAPGTPGARVQLQRRVGAHWLTVAGTRSAGRGSYTFTVTVPSAGVAVFRTTVPADRGFATSSSDPVTVRVG